MPGHPGKSCSAVGDVVFVSCKLRPLAALTGRLKHILYKHLCVCATHWLAQPKNNGCLPGPKSSVTLPKAWQSRAEMDSGIVSAIYFGPLQFLKGNQSTGQRHFREPCSNMSDEPGCNTQTQGGGRRGRKKNKKCAHRSHSEPNTEVNSWALRSLMDAASPFLH